MAYDLRYEPWIPWRRRSGRVEWGPPAVLVDGIVTGDPVVGIAAPRPDFDGALQEFLIGLLSAALRPADERAWRALWHTPPTREALQAALDALPPAFDLDGDGPRFCQAVAPELTKGETWSIETMLLNVPGSKLDQARKRQHVTDLFVKPGAVDQLGRPAAAMAVLTLQTYATEGGRGHLTSMRGGGPLTTLVEPRADTDISPLWSKLWANVETSQHLTGRTPHGAVPPLAQAFPWQFPTRAADVAATEATGPSDAHPLQAYFALPRRVRLLFGNVGQCGLTGQSDNQTCSAFRMRTYGVAYVGWMHPLSPHYRKGAKEWIPEHGRPTGLGWRDWLGIALTVPRGDAHRPASVVAAFGRRATDLGLERFRVHAFGYRTKQNKVLNWNDALFPAFVAHDQRQRLLSSTAQAFEGAANLASRELGDAVKAALFRKPDQASGDLTPVRAELWGATEAPFYDAMAALADASLPDAEADALAEARRRAFADTLRDQTLAVFDRWCPAAGLPLDVLRRRVVARHELRGALLGLSPLGEKLFLALGLAPPGGGRAARAAAKRATRNAKEVT
jgi:CRISPR system Cascade subunit CasA